MSNIERLKVLFVDDEPDILNGLRRCFRRMRGQWDIRCAESADAALALMREAPSDVIVSDMRMPGKSGAVLLNEVHRRWPDTVRFILSGQTDQQDLQHDIGVIHQFVQKPCSPESLERAITRATKLASVVKSTSLRKVTAGLRSLPIVTDTYTELVKVLDDPDSNADKVAEVVSRDVGLSVKLLQVINSSFFGLPREVRMMKEAIVLLGISNVKSLALSSKLFDTLGEDEAASEIISSLWLASSDIGALAYKIARKYGQPDALCDLARLAGTMSLIGRAVLARYMPENFQAARARAEHTDCKLYEAEAIECGAPQHFIGAYALGLWAFKDEVVATVSDQVDPESSGLSDSAHPLPYVHLARLAVTRGDIVEAVEPKNEWFDSIQTVGPDGRGEEDAA